MDKDERPVVVAILAKDCAVCEQMKISREENWNAIADALRQTGKVRVEKIEIEKMHTPVPEEYPEDLNRYHRFYPSIALINGRAWNEAKKVRKFPLSGVVYGGKIENGLLVADKTRPYPRTRKSLVDWVNAMLPGPVVKKDAAVQDDAATVSSMRDSSSTYEVNDNVARASDFCSGKQPKVYSRSGIHYY